MKYAIGDIHGNITKLKMLISSIEGRGDITKLIFLGDYIDRGDYSAETISFLIELSKKYDCTFLRGNHDDVFCFLLDIPWFTEIEYFVSRKNLSKTFLYTWFVQHGLNNTLDSYKVFDKYSIEQITANPNLIKECIPADHIEFFKNTVVQYEDDDVYCFHAFPGSDSHLKMWGRFENLEIAKGLKCSKPLCVGHTPVQVYGEHEPLIMNNVVLLDGLSWKPEGFIAAYCVTDKSLTYVT
jgi:serine/threonine protein phosphatase 1